MKKKNSTLSIVLFLLFFTLFCFSAYKIIIYFKDAKQASDLRNEIAENAITPLPEKNQNDESENKENNGLLQSDIPVLKKPDIQVNLAKIKKTYPGAIGWLYCPDTPIHYPVMQYSDNDYYVHRLPNGTENPAGSLFMDCRHKSDFTGFGQVIYGHNMKNRSMFGSILDYRKDGYFKEHPYLFYFTETSVYRLELFAGVHTIADSEYYYPPEKMENRAEYLSKLKKRSVFQADVSVTGDDKIMILSTCSGATGQDKRFILVGKLVPLQLG